MLLLTKSKGHKSNAPYSGFPNLFQSKSNLHISIHQNQVYQFLMVDPVRCLLGFHSLLCLTNGVFSVGFETLKVFEAKFPLLPLIFSMKYIKLYAMSRPKLTFGCCLKFEFTFYVLKPENFAFYLIQIASFDSSLLLFCLICF